MSKGFMKNTNEKTNKERRKKENTIPAPSISAGL